MSKFLNPSVKSMITKSSIATFCTILVILTSFLFDEYSSVILSTGLFAFSGSVTNWLAIHMLFEKIPFLYGSGVIPSRFLEFMEGIRVLIVAQFFNVERIELFLSNSDALSSHHMVDQIDYDNIFNELIEAIATSKLGSMLQIIGGVKALEPLREPIIGKLTDVVAKLTSSSFNSKNKKIIIDKLTNSIENLIDKRLDELSSDEVKRIVQNMIREHLGWLVVWGGVFGGIIGLSIELLKL